MIDKLLPMKFVADKDERLVESNEMIAAKNVTVSHRGEGTDVEIHTWKCRFKWVGQQGMTKLDYYPPTGVYSEPKEENQIEEYDWDF